MTSIYANLIIACWAVFITVWAVSAFGAKRTTGIFGGGWLALLRVVLVVLIIAFYGSGRITFQNSAPSGIFAKPVIEGIGVALTAAGIAFAIWARVYLGRNWGMPMSRKESREIVTTGPYAYVRHPIYTGVIAALFGSSLAAGAWWFGVCIASILYFIYSATVEERMLAKEFPDHYPAYRARTKMLIPFVF